MKKITVLLSLLCCVSATTAQRHEILDRQLHTLQVVVNDDPLQPPIMNLGGGNHLEIGFDEFSHEYHRYIYKVEHCNADWSPSTEIFESDYMNGFNGEPIEDYEKSFNTTVLYTHYSLRIPNENISLKLSGNYKLTVYNDEGDEPVPVLTACFSLVEPGVGIGTTVSTNTDIDFNKSHQQVDFSVNYGLVKVIDPHRELKTVVMQNRRWDNCVVNPKPNIQAANKIEFTHNRQLIFPAGNEYHKFEILDVHVPTLNVDRMEWFDPYYHATLYPNQTARNYLYDEDQNGAFIIRNSDDEDVATTCDYVFTHFTLKSPQLPGGEVYLNGEWTYNRFIPEYRMTYNRETQAYEATALLKQGYYNYNYLFVPDGDTQGNSGRTDGNFYETENEYIILVYHRPNGGRYDKLVGYRRMNFKINGK
ncbi:type IX secretion system plug protein [Paraprevotella xylaniphila]|uniref:type IX secretion system plug protein n=1 Tax=Paraprevotella xylaniphila TaxID=454155 RepID=UPI003FD82227